MFPGEPDAGPLGDGAVQRPAVIDETLRPHILDLAPKPGNDIVAACREKFVVIDRAVTVLGACVGRETPAHDARRLGAGGRGRAGR